MTIKKNRSLIVAVLALTAAGTYFLLGPESRAQDGKAARGDKAAQGDKAAPQGKGARNGAPPAVRLAAAQQQDVPIEVQANGTVVPLSSVEIRPHVSRLVDKVHVKEGQFVAAGALLFSLDDRSERAGLERAQAQLLRDQASLADLERQFKRSQDLAAQRFISASAADTLQTQVESQRAQVQADQAALRSAQVELSYTSLRAPSAGRIGAINVYPGSMVQVNAALASVTQIDPIGVSFTVPESGLSALLAGQKNGAAPVRATLSGPDRTLDGKLTFIDSAVDPVAGTIRVKAQFDNANTALWPGQFVNAKLKLTTLHSAVVVPLSAIITSLNGALVYTVDASQTAQQRKVGVLHAFGGLAAVSGLGAGEKIIVEGKQNLRPGAKVRVTSDTATTGAEPGAVLAGAQDGAGTSRPAAALTAIAASSPPVASAARRAASVPDALAGSALDAASAPRLAAGGAPR